MATATDPAPRLAPASASARRYLRSGLPDVFREQPRRNQGDEAFVLRFVAGLEVVLDPIVSMLDLLPAHFDPRLAPPEVVDVVGQWLGLDLPRRLPASARRRLVDQATRVTRSRGTREGLEQLLRWAFELPLEVEDDGGVSWSADPTPKPRKAPPPAFRVICPATTTAAERDAIRRLVAEVKPAHVRFTLEDAA